MRTNGSGRGALPRMLLSSLLPLALLFAAPARADALDTVLDVMHKAGVVDGNVVAAKPLIFCLADGKAVDECAGGSAQQTELASDPQVRNVIDIYLAFRDQDYYTVVKKAGITVGCALIPGGEVKDIACGELGKIAAEVLDGVGSVLGGIGGFVSSIFGGGDPDPIPEEQYYHLYFEPWLHWSVVHQLDNDTPANVQVLDAPMAACIAYYDSHTYSLATAKQACTNLRTRLSNSGWNIGNAFRAETESYFQLHFAPKMDEWAQMSFNNDNINLYAKQAMNTCVADERAHLPLPNPGFDQCQALKQSMAQFENPGPGTGIGGVDMAAMADQMYAQCQADANQRAVPAGNDAYSRICQPMVNRIVGKVIFVAMADLKQRMDAAAGAGCPNSGTPKSVHCDTWATRAACEKAIPAHASDCHLDGAKAWRDGIEWIWAQINTADAPCTAYGVDQSQLTCPHPVQRAHCQQALTALGDNWGPAAAKGITCETADDPAYAQMRDAAAQIVGAMNTGGDGVHGCAITRADPLVVSCDEGFAWNADPARADQVYTLVNAGNTGRPRQVYCPPDTDNDGAEAPCVAGEPLPDLPPPAIDVPHPLTPVRAAPIRLRPKPVIQGG